MIRVSPWSENGRWKPLKACFQCMIAEQSYYEIKNRYAIVRKRVCYKMYRFILFERKESAMEEKNTIISKSKKIIQRKKTWIVWLLAAILLVVTLVSFITDYSYYKKAQQFGLYCAGVASDMGGSSWIDEDDSYADQCRSVYHKLNSHTIYSSAVAESEDAVRESFANVMEVGGYDQYDADHVMIWFKYTNPMEYWTGYYTTKALPICLYIFFLFSIIFTLLLNRKAKKNAMIEEKREAQGNMPVPDVIVKSSGADEIKKYKELLDMGIISQEEFDNKKKQILEL